MANFLAGTRNRFLLLVVMATNGPFGPITGSELAKWSSSTSPMIY